MKGGKRPGAGRPKGALGKHNSGRKTIYKTFSVACLPDEWEAIKSGAEKAGKSISRYIVDIVLEKN